MKKTYRQIYDSSIKNRENFWREVAEEVFWYKKPTKILNSSNPPFFKWYEDGVTNTCYNAVDFHIDNGKGEKIAIIYDSPITGVSKKITYNELRENDIENGVLLCYHYRIISIENSKNKLKENTWYVQDGYTIDELMSSDHPEIIDNTFQRKIKNDKS